MKILIKNANIYTSNKAMPKADCIVYENKRVLIVGNERDIDLSEFNIEKTYDIGGRTLLPGIIDGHIHPGWVTKSLWHTRLPWTNNVDEILTFVKKYGEDHPRIEYPFLFFEYYPTSMFDKNGPNKELLDTAISDRPVLMQDFGEHLCWINTKMLELLGVGKDTPDPGPLETFVRDGDGNPTGWVREFAWEKFVDNMWDAIDWRPPESLTPESLKEFFDFLEVSGITAMTDGFIENDSQIRSIYELDQSDKLHCYYHGMVRFWSYEDLPEKIAKLRRYQKLYTSQHIKVNAMKLFLDGTNESGNSASLGEHINDPGNFGDIMMGTEELIRCFLLCNREGLDLHIHIVGDRGFRIACDAVEAAQAQAKADGESWVCLPIFAHCEIVDFVDMLRPAKLGIFINWSCHWAGGYFGEQAMNYYTEEKWRRMYRFNEMIESGAHVAFSSDVVTGYELHRAYPFFGMQVSATRVDPEFPLNPKKYLDSMRPDKSARLSLSTLLEGYTMESARQNHWENSMGSLEEGKLANMVIINKDLFEVPENEIKDIKTEVVIFDGKVIRGSL